ncbi:uncharacterized protein LOC141602313 [Silene latifolia]|uniref:uncharacterized protein LOC141602313 n=1 Tax=Silene latifolia TaxID=37657 RepID=UPI003D774881
MSKERIYDQGKRVSLCEPDENHIGTMRVMMTVRTSREVLVEVDVAGDLPTTVSLTSPYHGETPQRIIYEWLPYYCQCCRKLGHTKEKCKFTKINNRLQEVKSKKGVQEYRRVQTNYSHNKGDHDSGSHVLGHSPPKLGVESSTGTVELSSECQGLGSTIVPEEHSLPNESEEGSECNVLGQTDTDVVEVITLNEERQEMDTVQLGVSVSNNYSVLQSEGVVEEIIIEVPQAGEPPNPVEVFGLLETRVKLNNSADIIRKFPFYSVINNYSHHYNGRIWVFLDSRKITLLNSSLHDQLIHLRLLHHISNQIIYVTIIYGSNDGGHRDRLWDELRSVSGTVTNWIVLEDFNIVRDMRERIGPNPPSVTEIMAFNQCLLDCSLDDAHSFGFEHTWTNKRDPTARIWSRLDKVLLNSEWLTQFPTTNVQILPSGISDHSPFLVEVKGGYKIRRTFSYLNCWEDHKDYREKVTEAWDITVKGNHIFRLFTKMKNVRRSLISLHKTHYTGITQKVIAAREALETSQRLLQGSPLDPFLLAQEEELLARYLILRKTERSSLLQRAKIQDIKYKDAPTSYFFSRIAARKHQTLIGKIQDMNGNIREGIQETNAAFVEYYTWLLGQRKTTTSLDTVILDGPIVPESAWESLCKDIDDKEIKSALFSMDSNKSPSQDGFSAQ